MKKMLLLSLLSLAGIARAEEITFALAERDAASVCQYGKFQNLGAAAVNIEKRCAKIPAMV